MIVRLLGAHNCESFETKLSSLLIDGVLALDAGGLTSSLSFPEQLGLKAVLLTHQHYDHIRDIPALAMNFYLAKANFEIYATAPVYDDLTRYLLNGEIYPKFQERPPGNPTIRFHVVEPYRAEQVGDYAILAVPVAHSITTVGYQVTAPGGKVLFYTGDTGPGLAECWERVSPHLLVIEVTASNAYTDFGREVGHLTPGLLKEELAYFRRVKGYLPRVITVHMSPGLEREIEAEIAAVAQELGSSITLGYEGMRIEL